MWERPADPLDELRDRLGDDHEVGADGEGAAEVPLPRRPGAVREHDVARGHGAGRRDDARRAAGLDAHHRRALEDAHAALEQHPPQLARELARLEDREVRRDHAADEARRVGGEHERRGTDLRAWREHGAHAGAGQIVGEQQLPLEQARRRGLAHLDARAALLPKARTIDVALDLHVGHRALDQRPGEDRPTERPGAARSPARARSRRCDSARSGAPRSRTRSRGWPLFPIASLKAVASSACVQIVAPSTDTLRRVKRTASGSAGIGSRSGPAIGAAVAAGFGSSRKRRCCTPGSAAGGTTTCANAESAQSDASTPTVIPKPCHRMRCSLRPKSRASLFRADLACQCGRTRRRTQLEVHASIQRARGGGISRLERRAFAVGHDLEPLRGDSPLVREICEHRVGAALQESARL